MAPSFLKILLDPSLSYLPLPPAFFTKHLDNIPNGPVYISAAGGYSWRLKIKKHDGILCFTDGWSNVVNDIPLGFPDLLVFRLVDRSTFEMTIFNSNGCENMLPDLHKHVVVVDDDDNDDDSKDDNKDKNNDDDNDDQDRNDDDDHDFFFISKINKNMLRFSMEFAVLAGIDATRTMTVKNLDGKEWVMSVQLEKIGNSKRYYLSCGWRNFVRENDLTEGDECVFKFIKSEGKLLLANVTKKQMRK